MKQLSLVFRVAIILVYSVTYAKIRGPINVFETTSAFDMWLALMIGLLYGESDTRYEHSRFWMYLSPDVSYHDWFQGQAWSPFLGDQYLKKLKEAKEERSQHEY